MAFLTPFSGEEELCVADITLTHLLLTALAIYSSFRQEKEGKVDSRLSLRDRLKKAWPSKFRMKSTSSCPKLKTSTRTFNQEWYILCRIVSSQKPEFNPWFFCEILPFFKLAPSITTSYRTTSSIRATSFYLANNIPIGRLKKLTKNSWIENGSKSIRRCHVLRYFC